MCNTDKSVKMFGISIYHCFIVFVYVSRSAVSADGDVEMHPESQKVVENSPAIFTCESSVPGVPFSWHQSNRPLNEEKDDVAIKRVNNYTSVLRIDRADVKKHKRTYTCRVRFVTGETVEKRANLKVMTEKRLHKYFPHIVPISDANDIMVPTRDPSTIHLRCESRVISKKATPTWRWIKDGFLDLDIDPMGDAEKRIELTEEGDLIIKRATTSDSGTYMCVAENNRGSAYGTPFTLNVQEGPPIPRVDGCLDDKGVRYEFGETYNVGGDPCTTCTCMEGAVLSCQSVSCIPRPCPRGQRVELSSEECCEARCVPELEEIEETGHSAGVCMDRDGRAVESGDSFMPEEDPCLRCECNNGRRGRCMMVACRAPTCDNYIPSRAVCCDYTCIETPSRIEEPTCTDFNGRLIEDGEMYQPGSDPCETCECVKGVRGMCAQVACDEPTCRNYRLIPGTCCGFECPEEEVETVEIDLDDHESYHPSTDPCYSCMCRDGSPPACRSISCDPPEIRCEYGTRRVPGMCCQYECAEGPTVSPSEHAEKVLGRVFVQQIGSNSAFVQWKTPDKYTGMISNLTIYLSKNATDMRYARFINVGSRPHATVRDLDPNTDYHVLVNGTLGNGTARMTSRPVRFSLDGRGHSSFVLSDAIGQVFESRGSVAYDGYSLPRRFDPVLHTDDVKTVVNTESFHRVEVSRYNEAPCMDQDCGLLRFYMYNMEGESINVMSLMFSNEQDFSWAKAHL